MAKRLLLATAGGMAIIAGLHSINTAAGEPPNPIPPYPERRWYVSPDGDAGNDGSKENPWSVAHAFSGAAGLVLPADRIKFLPGYYAIPDGIELDVGGAAGYPLIIEFSEGVTLDFGIAAFREDAQNAWVPQNVGGIKYYRSADTYPQAAFAQVTGQVKIGDDWYVLAPHKTLEHLLAASPLYSATDPYYVGPGIYHDDDDYIYFRGAAISTANMGGHFHRRLPFTDPRNLDLRISVGTQYGITFNAPYVDLRGPATMLGCYSMFRGNAQHHLTFDGLTMHPQFFVGRFGLCDSVTFNSCYANGGLLLDTWIDRYSIKGGLLAADGARTCGLDVEDATNIHLDEFCVWENFFDGILGAPNGLVMRGLWRCLDDAFQMKYSAANITIGGDPTKLTKFEGAGPSRDGAGASTPNDDPGTIYLGFAIFDPTTRPFFHGRTGAPEEGYAQGTCLPTHGQPGVGQFAWMWKVYYCTFVIGELSTGTYLNAGPFGQTGLYESENRIHNCIFHMNAWPSGPGFGINGIGAIFRSYSGMEDYDGNVYSNWDPGRSIFRQAQTSTGTISAGNGLKTLAILYASQAYTDSLVYSDGWETHGIMVADVLLDENYIPAEPLTQVGAVDLTATGWPGTAEYKARRGAV